MTFDFTIINIIADITLVYRKCTFSGVFTNFKSFIPMTYKTGLLETMLFHCFSICYSYKKFHEEIVKLKEIFERNSYPEKFIELTVAKKELILVLPYLGQQSFEIRNSIQCCLKEKRSSFQLESSFSVKKTTFHAIYF